MAQIELPPDFKLTEEFEHAFDLMENSYENIYLTGKAGCGKSTLLHYFLTNTKKECVVLAPTGIAAVNVGGETIHSFFGFPSRFLNPREIKKRDKWNCFPQTIIIDEVSMVRADMIDNIDMFLRLNMNEPSIPFGGVQMIFIGDIYQLSPVVENELKSFFDNVYETPFFFSANVFAELNLTKIELTHIFRQTNMDFINCLNRVRSNLMTNEDIIYLNKHFNPMAQKYEDFIIYLSTTNKSAAYVNDIQLKKLKTPSFTFKAEVHGDFDPKAYPTDEILTLKRGAQIMLIRNNRSSGWINGTLAKIDSDKIEYENGKVGIYVILEGDEENEKTFVPKTQWGKIKYDVSSEHIKANEVGTFVQLPIKLAWALTIHKSQGQTFEKAIIDFGYGTFAHGQAYVALSRVKSPEGLFLQRPIRRKDIIMDEKVKTFMED